MWPRGCCKTVTMLIRQGDAERAGGFPSAIRSPPNRRAIWLSPGQITSASPVTISPPRWHQVLTSPSPSPISPPPQRHHTAKAIIRQKRRPSAPGHRPSSGPNRVASQLSTESTGLISDRHGAAAARSGLWRLGVGCGGSEWAVAARSGLWWLGVGCGGSEWAVAARSGLWRLGVGCGGSERAVGLGKGCGGSEGAVAAGRGLWRPGAGCGSCGPVSVAAASPGTGAAGRPPSTAD